MDTHKNAPTTATGRLRMVEAVMAGEPIRSVAQRCETDRKSVRKWVMLRCRAEGAGLRDRSSRPHRSPRAIPRGTAQRVITLRQRRWTMAHFATELQISRATVSRVLARAGLSRLTALDPAPLPRRYERARPGDLLYSTARSSRASNGRYTASPVIRGIMSAASATKRPSWPLTIVRAWRLLRCLPTNASPVPQRFSIMPRATIAASVSRYAAS